jgi:hypothetical protein
MSSSSRAFRSGGVLQNRAIVRQELSRHIDAITLLPEGEAVRYKGSWKLSGYTGGAEGAGGTLLPKDISVPFEGVFRRAA